MDKLLLDVGLFLKLSLLNLDHELRERERGGGESSWLNLIVEVG